MKQGLWWNVRHMLSNRCGPLLFPAVFLRELYLLALVLHDKFGHEQWRQDWKG
jgi:hypothetical protein